MHFWVGSKQPLQRSVVGNIFSNQGFWGSENGWDSASLIPCTQAFSCVLGSHTLLMAKPAAIRVHFLLALFILSKGKEQGWERMHVSRPWGLRTDCSGSAGWLLWLYCLGNFACTNRHL